MTEKNSSENKNSSVYELLKYSSIKLLESLKIDQLKNKDIIILFLVSINMLLVTSVIEPDFKSLKKNNPEEIELSKINMNDVCEFLKHNKEFIDIMNKKLSGIKIIDIKAVVRDIPTWEVYRWGCQVKAEGGITITQGIHLEEFCNQFSDWYISKPAYKDPQDKDSWYCVAIPGGYKNETKLISKNLNRKLFIRN